MTGKTHQVIGVTTALVTFIYIAPHQYSPASLAAVLVGSHLAALLPDIDQQGSLFWQKLPMGNVIDDFADTFLKHRNLSHSLIGTALVGWGLSYLTRYVPSYWGMETLPVFWSIMAAYASHLVADMFTVEGIPLLFPYQHSFGIPPNPLEGVRIVTGKWFENLVIFPIANIALIAVLWGYWPVFRTFLFR